MAIGPTYKAVSVRVQGNRTFLTAKLEGQQEILGGEEILKSYEEVFVYFSKEIYTYIGSFDR